MNAAPAIRRAMGLKKKGRRGGFTLVEVMVATVLLTLMILGILQVLIGAYRVAAKARYRDHARCVIKSFADQFLTQDTADSSGNTLTMFKTTVDSSGNATPLGTGLTWTNADGSAGTLSIDAIGAYFYVKLGDTTGAPITATVTRQVSYIYPGSGQTTLVTQSEPAGYLLEGDFTINYNFLGQAMPPQTIVAVRAVP
jgi:type II secretory pathway pseudopilin PulG